MTSTPTVNSDSTIYPDAEPFTEVENFVKEILEDADAEVTDKGNILVDISDFEEEYYIRDFASMTELVCSQLQNEFAYKDRVDEDSSVVAVSGFDDRIQKVDLSEISNEHEGELVRTEVQVQDLGEPMSLNITSTWKCQNGHYTQTRHPRWVNELEHPVDCDNDECHDTPTRRVKNEGSMTDTQQIVLTETDKDDRNSRNLIGEVDEPFVGELDRRDTVEVLAKVMMADRKNNSRVEPYLWILGYEPVGHTIELDDERKEELEELVEEYDDIVETLAESVAPQIVDRYGQKRAKKAVLCSLVRGAENTDRNMIHTLLYGKRGSGKSKIMEFAEDLAEVSQFVDAQSASEAGLTASASQTSRLDGDGEQWIVTGGAIPQAHNGVAFIDELDKADENVQTSIANPMSSGRVIKQTAGEGDLNAETSLVLACNPEGETYQGEEPIESLEIPIHIQDRCDLILRVDDEIQDRENEREVLREISKRKQGNYEVEVGKDTLQDYIAYARRKDVSMSEIAQERIVDHILDLRMEFRSKNLSIEMTGREQQKLTRLSSAMCKLRLGSEVRVEDVDRAWNLMLEGWQSVTFDAFDLSTAEVEA